MKDLEKDFEASGEKPGESGKTPDENLSGSETVIDDEVKVYVNGLIDGNAENRPEKDDEKGDKPVYEYRADGYVTSVYKDGAETVTVEKKRENKKAKTKGDKILGMVPFLDEESLHELTVQFTEGDLEIDMGEVLPFLYDEDVSLLINKITENNGEPFKGLALADLLPYADDRDISKLFIIQAKNGFINKELICYVDDDCWHEIVKEYCGDENSNLDIDEIYPYLDEDDLRLLFKTYLKRRK